MRDIFSFVFNKGAAFAVIAVIAFIALAVAIAVIAAKTNFHPFEPGYKRAGRRGEEYAAELIRTVMREGDRLFCNVTVSYDGSETEFDSVVVNKNGVFIIEVKNYNGRLSGGEDDFEWQKIKITPGGNVFEKTVKNPIRQVKRETFILANYLKSRGAFVWVEGYAIIFGAKSPVKSDRVLTSVADIDRVIHTPTRQKPTAAEVERIIELLS